MHKILAPVALAAVLALHALNAAAAPLPPDQEAALARISANSLRGHLSFIASDLLEGRGTPSRGLDLAAEYIAAQYRRAGLEPLGDEGYFQTAHTTFIRADLTGFRFVLKAGPRQLALAPAQLSFVPGAALDAANVAVIKANWADLAPLEASGAAVAGKVVLVERPLARPSSAAEYQTMAAERKQVFERLAKLKPLLVLVLDRSRASGDAGGRGRVGESGTPKVAPVSSLTLHGADAAAFVDALPAGTGPKLKLDVHLAKAITTDIKLRNVAALLRGSDPVLKDSYVVLSAHYDHLGIDPNMPGDNIYNGANDDGSGTVSVIEVASALATLPTRPKRSILFLNLYGEELGMLGSEYYGRHPLVPIAKTVANLNLEQVGRTDGKDGPNLGKAALTGFDFSSLPQTLVNAGKDTGVEVYRDAAVGDIYFAQSDNRAFADLGIPAHTMSVLYEFPDYHKAGDHWDKIDYNNMARMNRMVALGVMRLANDLAVPRWNPAQPKAAPYLKTFQSQAR